MAEPQDYTIANWSPWIDKVTGQPVTDAHNNVKGSVLFEEDRAEPIDATFKPPVEVGQKKYGVVDLYQTKAGSMRKGFQRRDRPQPGYGGQPVQAGQVASAKYPRNDEHTQESIARSVALKAAVDTFAHYTPNNTDSITPLVLKTADTYLAWLQGSSESTDPKATERLTTSEQGGNSTSQVSGYDKAKAVAQNLRRDDRDEDQEVRSLVENVEHYELQDIPPEYQ